MSARRIPLLLMPQQLQAGDGEDWTGIIDRKERKKLQDRINQRARRQREKIGFRNVHERGSLTPRNREKDMQLDLIRQNPFSPTNQSLLRNELAFFTACQPDSEETSQFIKQFSSWMAQRYLQDCLDTEPLLSLVQFNVTRSLVANARILGYTSQLMARSAQSPFTTLNIDENFIESLPGSLRPTVLQLNVPHHPWIDLLPVSELRDNLLRRNENTYDAAELCRDLRGFQLVRCGRGGVVVWGDPWDPHGWEVTVAFAQKWPWVINGSRTLLESTKYWRGKRGESDLYFQDYSTAHHRAHPRVTEIEERLDSTA